jgi:tetratricopeptide (TPR) repeat protein
MQQKADLAGAVEAYRASLALDGGNIAAHSNLGAALVGLGRFDEAIPEYQKALEQAPEQYRTLLRRNLALAYYKSGRMHEAAPILVALHDADPASHPAALLAADCLLQLGEPARALEILEPLAGEADADRGLAYVLGIAYMKNGKTVDAQRVLDPILRDDSSAEGQYALGMAMFTSGDYPAAVTALRRAIGLNPALAHIQSYYGQALIFSGDPDGALQAFGKQLAADANDYDANYQSAAILLRRSKFAEAEPLLRRAVLLRPKASEARLGLADALIGEGRAREARSELEGVVREWPEFGTAHARLAGVYGRAGLAAEAAREQALSVKYAVKAEESPAAGPAVGAAAPAFVLARAEGGGTDRIPSLGKATVLVFGSYTCPNFRKAAPVLNELAGKLQGSVRFAQVYIREAHAAGQWQSTVNERENVELAMPASMDEKNGYAVMCNRKLHLRFPALVDGLDNAAEKAYAAWPSRVYVIGADGKVRYSSALIEEDFDPKALEAAIRSAARLPR